MCVNARGLYVSQPSLASVFSILARVTSANPLHSAMLMISSPKLRTLKFIGGGPTLLHLHSRLTAKSVTNGVMWTSIYGSPILSWSLHCQSNTMITQACRIFNGAPLPPSRNLLSLFQELGPSRHFPLAAGVRIPQQLQSSITSTCDLGF